ncbi:alpha/beta fold hydrolase [Rubrobacter indicoceani]|uniref:alpha/beta fold hydrolase n=1 Tax=Rubrobacter indicoceani TaxID=2051957 RepID=UPI0013C52B34|nr:alpha/beta fold hydrolase [Rubrobacter indicoceani]
MSRFVLVHGAWHGAWCWAKVVPLLEKAGHEVVVFDLPGHGDDETETGEVSLQAYTDRVVEALDASEQGSVLVGHSMGGLPISEAAEARPQKVEKLVFLTAFMLRDGQTLLEVAGPDRGLVIPNLEFTDDRAAFRVTDDKLVDAFYADCSESDVANARRKLVWQAAAPFATPVKVTEVSAGIPRAYIECTDDRAITIETQRNMQSAYGAAEVVTMQTSHSPFLSQPEELAKNLDKIAA